MNLSLVEFTERLIPISEFSQGKAGKIFSDVAENNSEYLVMKNNQPTAVIVSVKEYKMIQEKIKRLEALSEKIENMRMLKLAEGRLNDKTTSFEDFIKTEGFSEEELKALAESVDFE